MKPVRAKHGTGTGPGGSLNTAPPAWWATAGRLGSHPGGALAGSGTPSPSSEFSWLLPKQPANSIPRRRTTATTRLTELQRYTRGKALRRHRTVEVSRAPQRVGWTDLFDVLPFVVVPEPSVVQSRGSVCPLLGLAGVGFEMQDEGLQERLDACFRLIFRPVAAFKGGGWREQQGGAVVQHLVT